MCLGYQEVKKTTSEATMIAGTILCVSPTEIESEKGGEGKEDNDRLNLIFRQYFENLNPTLCLKKAKPFSFALL